MKGVYLDPMKDKDKYEDPTRYRARTKEAKTSKKGVPLNDRHI